MKILILADANPRACITLIRTVEALKINYSIATTNRKLSIYTNFSGYNRKIKRKHCGFYSTKNCDEFIDSLLNLNKENSQMILFPNGEKLLRWSLKNRDVLKDNNIYIPTVNYKIYNTVSNKESFVELVEKYGLTVPTKLLCIPRTYKSPFVIKPRSFTSNCKETLNVPLLIESNKHFQAYKKLNIDESLHFAQEFITGPSFYYCASYNNGSKMKYFAQQTVLQEPDGGSVFLAIPASLPNELIDKIDSIMRDLNWLGVMMIELKYYKNKYYAIECNPRFWGPLQLSVDNGIYFAEDILSLVDIKPNSITSKNTKNSLYGYIWIAGFLNSLLKMISSKKSVQYYPPLRGNIFKYKYRDVWLRKDTLFYFFIEIITLIPFKIASFFRKKQ
jgi:predicted ATP-grasp superfamily ATP-dependent carboligase